MTTSFLIFVVASIIVVLALLYALSQWLGIRSLVQGGSKTAATLFCICFALYAIGQTIVILQVLKWVPYVDVSSYLYALAAILFAVGSYYQYQGLK